MNVKMVAELKLHREDRVVTVLIDGTTKVAGRATKHKNWHHGC